MECANIDIHYLQWAGESHLNIFRKSKLILCTLRSNTNIFEYIWKFLVFRPSSESMFDLRESQGFASTDEVHSLKAFLLIKSVMFFSKT